MKTTLRLKQKESTYHIMDNGTTPTLDLIVQLCKALEVEGIRYCHWKSNAALNRSASGENDLDLLVKRSDIQRFRGILLRLGFKESLTNKIKELPGVQSYFGYDQNADKIIHVHAHYQLIIGHDHSKNYHLPVEGPYLDSAQHQYILKTPSPEFELVVFAIRMILKHSTWDTILFHEGDLSKTEKQELVYLEARADRAIVESILNEHLPFIDSTLFDECLSALRLGCSLMKRIKTGWRLQNRLTAYARRSRKEDLIIKLWHRIYLIFIYRVLRNRLKYRLAHGGAVVAIVGGDGAGKTTVVDGLYKWLSRYFDTKRTHMGKPHWSTITILFRGLLKLGVILHLFPFERTAVQYSETNSYSEFAGFPWLIRHVCTAHDRFLTYMRVRRFASNGGIVICDRYPLENIEFMESPITPKRFPDQLRNHWLVKWLIDLEKNYYQKILHPDILIVLQLEPDIAVSRKQDESELSVRARSTEIWKFNWYETSAFVVDASRSKEEVLSEIKNLLWSEL
jgi:thymidylate kinase